MRFAGPSRLLLLLACFLPAAARAAEEPPDLARLLATVRNAGAVTRDAHVARTATVTIDDRTYRLLDDTAGDRAWTRRCDQDICEGVYFDGSRSYDVGINGTALPRTLHADPVAITMRASESGAFATSSFAAAGGSVASLGLLPAAEVVPKDCAHQFAATLRNLAVTAPNGALLHVLIDPHRGLVAAIRSNDDASTLALCDYRRVGRYRVPFQRWRDGKLVRQEQSIVLDPAAPSAPRGLDVRFEGAPSAIPMQTVRPRSNQPVVPCSLGGVGVACLIDTGNSGLGISLDLVERLDLPVSGEFAIAGLGQYLTGIVQAGPLRVGAMTLGSARFVVLHDLHDLGYDVVLGADALAAARVTLDYPHRAVTFTPHSPADAQATIPLRFASLLPIVGAQFGALDASLTIDTGDESNVDLAQPFYAAHAGLFVPSSSRSVAGIGGVGQQVLGTIPDVRIATYDVVNQPIGATDAAGSVADGRLGSGFLSHFSVIFDYANGRLGLWPRGGDPAVRSGD
ncbi:MAG: retropepsin-like aspartic protease [Candidatus Baltobacteraceae bacterium]